MQAYIAIIIPVFVHSWNTQWKTKMCFQNQDKSHARWSKVPESTWIILLVLLGRAKHAHMEGKNARPGEPTATNYTAVRLPKTRFSPWTLVRHRPRRTLSWNKSPKKSASRTFWVIAESGTEKDHRRETIAMPRFYGRGFIAMLLDSTAAGL